MKRLLQTLAVSAAFLLVGGSANAQTDLSKMRVAAISEALTTQPEAGKYYLLEQNRGGTMTPAGDTGEGNTITRASSADAVSVDDRASNVANYLLQFIPTDDVSETGVGGVYILQYATGNYWVSIEGFTDGDEITTTSNAEEVGIYNVYPTTTGGNLFGLNAFDMDKRVDNNGVGAILTGWGSGQNTATNGNNVWTIYEVTFEEMSDEYWELRDLVAEAQAAYDANEDVREALISSTKQFSSPYTYEGSLDNLLDGDANTFWHSDWSSSVPNGTHYIQVDLADDFAGGDLILSILRRNNANNQVVKMSIKDGDDSPIAEVDLPYNGQGETVEAEFTCPEGIYTLRFYNEGTVGDSQQEQGFFHLAGLQLYYADYIIGNNTKYPEVAAALAEAIAEAQAIIEAKTATAADVAAMQAALDTYLAEIAPLLTVLAYESVADIDEWTTTGNNGTFVLNDWSTETDESGMVTPFCQNWIGNGNVLTDAIISHKTLVGMPEGNYTVSIFARVFNENSTTPVSAGISFGANETYVDLAEAGTSAVYNGVSAEVYGTYSVNCTVGEDGLLDIGFTVAGLTAGNWLAWKDLKVTLSTEEMPALTALDGKMSAAAEEAMTAAIEAYNADDTEANFTAAIAAIQDAQASIEEYAEIAALVDALDKAGLAVWNATESGAAYNAGTLDAGTDITVDMAAAQIAQTTAGSDMTYVVLYTGDWTGNTGTYVDGVERYGDEIEFEDEVVKVLYKSLEGLTPGTYEVTFYAVANNAWVSAAVGDGIAQIFANDVVEDVTVYDQTACTPSDYPHTIQCTVGDDGTLEFGLQNIATGGNWYVCQAVGLTLVEASEAEEEEEDLSELIAQYEADLTDAATLAAEIEESIAEADETSAEILAEILAGLQEAISIYGNIDTTDTTKEALEAAIAALEAAIETASSEYSAISSLATSTEGNDVIYTIGGTRVSKAVKGVYIVNGKKVLVK